MAVLGDSLAYGLGASSVENGLAHLIFTQLRQARPGSTYANFGVPHSTMGDVLRAQIPQLQRASAQLVLLIAGSNDLRFTHDASLIMRRFKKLLEAVHEAAPNAFVTVGGMPDVTQTIAVPPYLRAVALRLCRRINGAMRNIVTELDDDFIDLFEFTNAPLQPDRQYLSSDGYHPADFGHAEIATRAFPSVMRALMRDRPDQGRIR
jgi:lysophospholipase L1-like esterase